MIDGPDDICDDGKGGEEADDNDGNRDVSVHCCECISTASVSREVKDEEKAEQDGECKVR